MRLTLHSEPLAVDKDGVPRIGCRTFTIRDDLGREVETSMIAFGQLGGPVAGLFGHDTVGEETDGQVVAERATLDAGAEYILIVVPFEADRR